MAWMNQERKAKIAANLKPVLKKYGIKGTLRVRNHSAIVLTLKSGKIDFISNSNRVCGNNPYQVSRGFKPNTGNYCSVNQFWFQDHYDGDAKAFLTEVYAALQSADYYDRSDAMTDYFDTAYYMDVNIGNWQKPYEVTK
jgi:hypothetical protein